MELGLYSTGSRPGIMKVVLIGHSEDESGRIYLSADCITEGELNYWLNYLEKQIEVLRKKGAREFKNWDRKPVQYKFGKKSKVKIIPATGSNWKEPMDRMWK